MNCDVVETVELSAEKVVEDYWEGALVKEKGREGVKSTGRVVGW
jgi:hypothetical protein